MLYLDLLCASICKMCPVVITALLCSSSLTKDSIRMLCFMIVVVVVAGAGEGMTHVHRLNKTDKTQIEKFKNLAPQICIKCPGIVMANWVVFMCLTFRMHYLGPHYNPVK